MTQKKWNLSARLNRLPADQLVLIRNVVTHKAGISKSTYYRVLREEYSPPLHVLQVLAETLNCKIDDVMNPEYKFTDPGLQAEPEQDAAAELGLSK